jgi:hypothetical protein
MKISILKIKESLALTTLFLVISISITLLVAVNVSNYFQNSNSSVVKLVEINHLSTLTHISSQKDILIEESQIDQVMKLCLIGDSTHNGEYYFATNDFMNNHSFFQKLTETQIHNVIVQAEESCSSQLLSNLDILNTSNVEKQNIQNLTSFLVMKGYHVNNNIFSKAKNQKLDLTYENLKSINDDLSYVNMINNQD